MSDFPDRIFVTGTDTDVGKTVVSATLCSGLSADYWKPVQAGIEPMTDRQRVCRWAGLPQERSYGETFCLQRPMSPHAAAEAEGVEIDMRYFKLPESDGRPLVVEGAGGLLVPLNRREMILDLIIQLGIPVLLVGRSGLGTLNHTLMSIHILEASGVTPWGIVLNGEPHPSNEEAIRHFGKVERLYRFPILPSLTPASLNLQFQNVFHFHAS